MEMETLTCCSKADQQQHSEHRQTYSPLGLYGLIENWSKCVTILTEVVITLAPSTPLSTNTNINTLQDVPSAGWVFTENTGKIIVSNRVWAVTDFLRSRDAPILIFDINQGVFFWLFLSDEAKSDHLFTSNVRSIIVCNRLISLYCGKIAVFVNLASKSGPFWYLKTVLVVSSLY